MIELLSVLLTGIFIFIAVLHFYWAAGGRWAAGDAAPTNEQGKPLLNTGPLPCIVVGVGLLLFACHYVLPLLSVQVLPFRIIQIIDWIIPSIFLIRAIGDFRYVGLTKKLKSTAFARKDTQYYTPLCLLIAVLGFTIMFLN